MKPGGTRETQHTSVFSARSQRKLLLIGCLGLLLTASLSGCGASSDSKSGGELLQTPISASSSTTSSKEVVSVDGTPITLASFEHWLGVTSKIEANTSAAKHKGKAAPPEPPDYTACVNQLAAGKPKATKASLKSECEAKYVSTEREVLGFLITSDWVRAEAAHLHLSVSEPETSTRLNEVKSKEFPKESQFKSFMASSGESMSNLLERIKVELLESKISESVVSGHTATTESHVLLTDFEKNFEKRWRAQTNCTTGYVMEDCEQYKPPVHAKPGPQVAAEENAEKVRRGEAGANYGGNAESNSTDETYNTPGGLSLLSPAFERNGTIPAAYTCDGAGISPPFEWEKVPSNAKSLVLFVIDDSSSTTEGGIRWVLANINPNSKGVAAGKVPSGAVVGTGTSGKAGYSPICPAKGKTDQVEFVMYALRKPVKAKPGFSPEEIESEYGAGKLAITSATNYAQATRAG